MKSHFQELKKLAGAWVFQYLELPMEEDKYQLKLEKNKDVDNAVDYLKTIFWQYANNQQKYNYSRNEFRETVSVCSITEWL